MLYNDDDASEAAIGTGENASLESYLGDGPREFEPRSEERLPRGLIACQYHIRSSRRALMFCFIHLRALKPTFPT